MLIVAASPWDRVGGWRPALDLYMTRYYIDGNQSAEEPNVRSLGKD
jgi:hypothetical protein